MASVALNGFIEETERRFGGEIGAVLRRALDLAYPLGDMILLVCLYVKHTSDPLVNERAFIADGHTLGLMTIVLKIKEISAAVEGDRTEGAEKPGSAKKRERFL